jgi:hypothetical protein
MKTAIRMMMAEQEKVMRNLAFPHAPIEIVTETATRSLPLDPHQVVYDVDITDPCDEEDDSDKALHEHLSALAF